MISLLKMPDFPSCFSTFPRGSLVKAAAEVRDPGRRRCSPRPPFPRSPPRRGVVCLARNLRWHQTWRAAYHKYMYIYIYIYDRLHVCIVCIVCIDEWKLHDLLRSFSALETSNLSGFYFGKSMELCFSIQYVCR